MPKFFSRIPKTDPAQARYPEAMAGLLTLGEPGPNTAYADWADRLRDHAADLVRMVLDDDLNHRRSQDPAVWAPIHALRILGLLGPAEAAEPLLTCMDRKNDWFDELPPVYGAIGPSAIPLLKAYLEDTSHNTWGRGRASSCLKAIADAHPAARDEVVALLTAFLDRPAADASAAEETLTAKVIADLCELKATTSYEAIRRAYEQNRVDTQVVDLEGVERELGMRPPLDFSNLPKPTEEPGVRLSLKCKACGRERDYVFKKVYYDLGTMQDKKKREKYDPLIIPERVVCSKCGAVDQYELGGMSYMFLIASTLSEMGSRLGGGLRPDQRVTFITFTTRWGNMHPLEAIERYQQEIGQHPDDISLRIGLGNVYKFIGRLDEAQFEYEHALALDPEDPEVWTNLAQLAGLRKDIPEAIRCFEQALATLPNGGFSAIGFEEIRQDIQDSLAELRTGIIPEFVPPMRREDEERPPATSLASARSSPVPIPRRVGGRAGRAPEPAPEAVPAKSPSQRRVGRNDPCPCGSGKKYKHCHGRQG